MKHYVLSVFKQSSYDALIEKIDKFQNLIRLRNSEFVRRLAEVGIPVIDNRMGSGEGDSNPAHTTRIEVTGDADNAIARLVVEGEDLLFIEFGAGIYYNNGNIHPKGAENGYTIGSYGKGQGLYPGYWWYKDGDRLRFSRGTEATMPVYHASLEIIQKIDQIAKEVFSSGGER